MNLILYMKLMSTKKVFSSSITAFHTLFLMYVCLLVCLLSPIVDADLPDVDDNDNDNDDEEFGTAVLFLCIYHNSFCLILLRGVMCVPCCFGR